MQHEFHSVRDLPFKAIEAEIFNKFCLVIFSQTTKLYWWLGRSLFSVRSLPFLFDSFIYIYIFSSALYTGIFTCVSVGGYVSTRWGYSCSLAHHAWECAGETIQVSLASSHPLHMLPFPVSQDHCWIL